MAEVCELQIAEKNYMPLTLDEEGLKSIKFSEVITVDYTRYCPTYPIKYYKNVKPEIGVLKCDNC